MESSSWPSPGRDGDFVALLSRHGWPSPPSSPVLAPVAPAVLASFTQATTILGFHCADGVIMAGDRRATAGHTVIFDRADKVLELDAGTIMAIAGTPATAFDMARVLQHSFQYYRRSQLQPLSREAKVRALGDLLRRNLPLTLQGVGVVVPLLAAREASSCPQLYFYDALGAQFQAVDFAVSGSGSPSARSVLQYLNRWGEPPPVQQSATEAAKLALQLLDVAAESDTATGGIDRRTHVFPQVKLLSESGIRDFGQDELSELFGNSPLAKARSKSR